MQKYDIRYAERNDVATILRFIKELAKYEHMANEVVATESVLEQNLFDKKQAEVIIISTEGADAGFALFFHNFSTFLGKSGLYLEDLYVKPEYRGRGLGKALLTRLAEIADERNCGRLEWCCLNWNKPSKDFYVSMGAKELSDWRVFRVTENGFESFGKKK